MKWDKYKLYLFIVIAAFLPWSMTVTSAISILLLVITVAEGDLKYKLRLLKSNFPLLLLVAYFLVHLVFFLPSVDKMGATSVLEKKLSILLFPFVFAAYKPERFNIDRDKIFGGFVLSILVASVYCLAYAFYRNYTIGDPATLPYSFAQNFDVKNTWGLYWDYFSYSELSRPVRLHPTYFSMYTVFSVIILLNQLLKGKQLKRVTKVLFVLAILFLLVITFLLASRIAVLGLLLSLCVFFYTYIRENGLQAKQVLVSGGIVAVLTLLLFILPITRYRIITETSNLFKTQTLSDPNTGVSQRTVVWNTAFDLSQQNLLSGIGLGDVQNSLDKSYENQGRPDLVNLNAHNQYLQAVLATGLPGALLLVFILLYALYIAYTRRDGITLAFIIIIMTTCFTESILEANKGVVFFSLFYCLLFCCHQKTETQQQLP